jgi:hypothetical protein
VPLKLLMVRDKFTFFLVISYQTQRKDFPNILKM